MKDAVQVTPYSDETINVSYRVKQLFPPANQSSRSDRVFCYLRTRSTIDTRCASTFYHNDMGNAANSYYIFGVGSIKPPLYNNVTGNSGILLLNRQDYRSRLIIAAADGRSSSITAYWHFDRTSRAKAPHCRSCPRNIGIRRGFTSVYIGDKRLVDSFNIVSLINANLSPSREDMQENKKLSDFCYPVSYVRVCFLFIIYFIM